MKIRTALARAFVLDPSQLFRLFRKHSLLVHDHRPYFLPGVVCHKRIVPASHVSRTSSSGLGKTKGEERRREREREIDPTHVPSSLPLAATSPSGV